MVNYILTELVTEQIELKQLQIMLRFPKGWQNERPNPDWLSA
jgi:hypothetical protein